MDSDLRDVEVSQFVRIGFASRPNALSQAKCRQPISNGIPGSSDLGNDFVEGFADIGIGQKIVVTRVIAIRQLGKRKLCRN